MKGSSGAGSKTFGEQCGRAAFLLGGIGTGNVSVGARGELRDWEIFNSPGKGNALPYSFFALRVKRPRSAPIVRVLEARLQPPYDAALGFPPDSLAGLPRFARSRMKGEYPFAWVDLKDDALPVAVRLEAFTPFVPLEADDSGLPVAVLRYKVTNKGRTPVEVTVAGSLINAVGYLGTDPLGKLRVADPNLDSEYRRADGLQGVRFFARTLDPNHQRFGTMALATTNTNATVRPQWKAGEWTDGIQEFWTDFVQSGLREHAIPEGQRGSKIAEYWHEFVKRREVVGSVAVTETVAPRARNVFEFFISWHFPNRIKGWAGLDVFALNANPEEGFQKFTEVEKNWYAMRFSDAWDVSRYTIANMERLEKGSRDFHDALYGSTLPSSVIEALANNITVLRSPTCFRISNGTMLCWEGVSDLWGGGEGSCTHVWNYAQTMAFLFPALERTMRQVEFGLETDESGRMAFRTKQVFGEPRWKFPDPAADGQLGTIVRLYREWKLCGDDSFLSELWPAAARALDFAFGFWDADGDLLLEGSKHVTYDIEFHGPEPLTASLFLAALRAGKEMAACVGDAVRERRYREAFQAGRELTDKCLWNGRYFRQVELPEEPHKYQYGEGCLSDQLFGQFLAHVAGLGYVLPRAHVRTAIKAVFDNNFRSSLAEHQNVQRTYVLNNERGLVMCSWPADGRPSNPFSYSDEIWTGVEYQVAAHLIYEGFVAEGLTIVDAIRERYDGIRRNPWSEEEAGHHYARSLASWALLPALSGFSFDVRAGTVKFAPVVNRDDFRCFFITGRSWGVYAQKKDRKTGRLRKEITVLHGDTSVRLGG